MRLRICNRGALFLTLLGFAPRNRRRPAEAWISFAPSRIGAAPWDAGTNAPSPTAKSLAARLFSQTGAAGCGLHAHVLLTADHGAYEASWIDKIQRRSAVSLRTDRPHLSL